MKTRLIFILPLFICLEFDANAQTKDNAACRELYNLEKFQEAYECYSKDDQEIFSVYMSAYLAKFLELKKEYKKWSKKLFSKDFNSSETYYYGANLYPSNTKKFLKTLNTGLKKFPNDTLILAEKINYYIAIKDYEMGIPIIDDLLEYQVNDLPLFIQAGQLYVMSQKLHKAIPYFEQALELDTENFEAHFQLGIIYYKQAANLLQVSKESKDEADKLKQEAVSLLRKALPHLEKVHKINPENTDIKSALLTCYLQLNMDEKYQTLKDS